MHPFHAPAAVTALLALSPLLAQAADGDSAFAVRGSISAGSAWRTAERDANLIQRTNGSAAGIPANAPHGRNQDDGNLNFDKGDTLSRVVKGFLHLACSIILLKQVYNFGDLIFVSFSLFTHDAQLAVIEKLSEPQQGFCIYLFPSAQQYSNMGKFFKYIFRKPGIKQVGYRHLIDVL